MSPEREGCEAATRFRSEHRLGHQPLGDLIEVIEQGTGIDVAVLQANSDEHGLTVCDPKSKAVFVGIAVSPKPMRQRSTLAHELAHVMFQDWSRAEVDEIAKRSPREIRADSFARHLLIPREGLLEFVNSTTDFGEGGLSAVVQRFLVSPSMAAIALHQAGVVDQSAKSKWMSVTTPYLAARYGWRDQYTAMQAVAARTRAPQRLLARAIAGYAEGVLSAQAIATLRGITLGQAESELQEAGVRPREDSVSWGNVAELPDIKADVKS